MARAPLPPSGAEALLEHAQWMRRLARSLVGDGPQADDLTQETWRRWLEHPPSLERPFQGWITTVMRNLVRAERRGNARRETRERALARSGSEPSSHELVERAALQRELVQAVLELEEPYRSTILLRYFEERTPSEIAAREAVPLATVKTRLARGLARLRHRLARTQAPDGRTSALLALADLAPRGPVAGWIPGLATTLAMQTKLVAPLLLGLVAGLLYWFSGSGSGSTGMRPGPATSAASSREPEAPAVAQADPVALPTREATASTSSDPAGGAPREAPVRPATRGRVIDLEGAGVAEVEIVRLSPGRTDLASATGVARSDPEGAFELPDARAGNLLVRDPRWTTLLAGMPVDGRSGQECRIVVAPRLALSGIVIDERGTPLAGARVRLVPPPDLRARLAQVLDFSVDVSCTTTSDELGRFHLPEAPALREGLLRAEREGFRASEEPAPTLARTDLVLVLRLPEAQASALTGLVVDPSGLPVEGARVALGLETTRTDPAGRFTFRLDDPASPNRRASQFLAEPDARLTALAPGLLPAEARALGRAPDGTPRFPDPLVLRLGAATTTIAGRVVDSTGQPRAGLRVWIADPAVFGFVSRETEAGPRLELATLEGLLAEREERWAWVETDPEGRFELEGLTEREYDLATMDPSTLVRAVAERIAAGRRDVVLVLPTQKVFPRLVGRVRDGRGQPVENLRVFPMCDALETRLAGALLGTQHATTPGTLTDSEGRFELERVPEELVYLRLEGADTLPLEWGRGLAGGLARLADGRPEALEITVERRCHFQVELADPGEADELAVLDGRGEPQAVSEFLGRNRREHERHRLVDGRSSTLAVGDRARTLVLYRQGAEVRRAPLVLTPGAPTTLRF